jgi:hypothetical protein
MDVQEVQGPHHSCHHVSDDRPLMESGWNYLISEPSFIISKRLSDALLDSTS